MSRVKTDENVKRRLYAESMGRCMNPDCKTDLFVENGDIIEKAHIIPYCETADNAFENLIVLCPNCHTKYDKNHAFKPEQVKEWKNIRREELKRVFSKKFETFEELKKDVVPILSENKSIYENYYLNGKKELWNKFEIKLLVNNRKLKNIFENNLDLFQSHSEKSYSNLAYVQSFITHVDEFEATRTDEEKNRFVLFPKEINSMFAIEPIKDYILPSTESLECLIEKLNDQSIFRNIVMGNDHPYIEIIEDGKCDKIFFDDMANNYVETYSNILKKQHIANRYNEIKNNDNISDFSKNPFQLTLLLFLMEFPCEINDPWDSISLYKLYNLFIELWIKKENKQTDTNKILHTLIFASKELYYGVESKVTDNRPVIRDLFHFSYKENTVTEFCHRSLAAFFLAKNILDLTTEANTNIDLEYELQKELNNDVTQFIRSAADSYEDDVILSIQKKIQNLYFQVSIKEKSGTQSPKEYINCLSVKNGIVYLTTRLRNVENIATNFLQAISDSETDIRMKVTISYGAAKLGLQDVAMKFAEEYYSDNSELEKATRSFSLVYYRDVEPKCPQSLYKYKDDGKVPWKNSRTIRLKNLLSDKKTDKDFRILDVPLLYCFYKSRKWKDANLDDYNQYISSIKIDEASYTKEVYVFLNEKVKLLQTEYFKALFSNEKTLL